MFKKNTSNPDIKKSQIKCLDLKKDIPTRLKHLKAVLDIGDLGEAKFFLENNYSIVFHLFFDSFLSAEANLKQKGAFAVQRSHREDLECCLFILDRILLLLPDLIKQKWQCNALTHIFKKLLHPSNTIKLKLEAMKMFLMWYMIVGDQRTADMDCMFTSLVQGFPVPPPPIHEVDAGSTKVTSGDPTPIYTSASTEKLPDDVCAYMLKSLLESMVSQPRRIEWREQKQMMQAKCFSHVFGMFKSIYLPYIFPHFNNRFSIYKPTLDLPELRNSPGPGANSVFRSCPVVLVEWVKNHIIIPPRKPDSAREEEGSRRSVHNENPDTVSGSASSGTTSAMGGSTDQDSLSSNFYQSDSSSAYDDRKMVHDILFGSRENVNFIHEVFRQSLRLCFRYSQAMKTVVQCYNDWIKLSSSNQTTLQNSKDTDLPSFMMEPNSSELEGADPLRKLRNDSYVGAMSAELHVRAGLQNVLQIFVTSAANAFLLVVSPDFPRLLDEQVDLCKLILNIYRYMVMNTRMEQKTWEQLLTVLFHITSLTLSGKPNKHKGDSLGRRFASALFQTLVVSCIKANLSVVISTELWDQLLGTLVNLTHWEELIKEWAKTMDTLTKVLARHVYGLELDNLPLDRVTERKALKRGATKIAGVETSRNTLSRVLDSSKRNVVGGTTPTPSMQNQSNSGRPSEESTKLGYQRRSSVGGSSTSSQQKLSGGESNAYLRSHSDSYNPYPQRGSKQQPSAHHQSQYTIHHHQYRDGYFRHHIYSSRRKFFKALSDPNLYRKNSQHYEDYRQHVVLRMMSTSRSLDYIPYGTEEYSRSASPAPSSGIETSSLKESPLQMDFGGDSVSIDTLDGGFEQRSVMAGGSVRGWLPDVSVILWRRVLGLLGDPNETTTPAIHEQIFKYLLELTEKLIKLRDNQGISNDNQATPDPPELVPPLRLLAPWCFKALVLPAQYSAGKLLAYTILCKMLVRKQDVPIPKELLAHFYTILHQGLVGPEQEIISTLVGGCSPNFFSLGLPGSSMLALDFIYATNTVISSNDPKLLSSRYDALSLLGSLYPIASLYPMMPVLQPSHTDFTLIKCNEVKDHLINVLLKCAKRDSYAKTRSLALCALATYIYHELATDTPHSKVPEAVNVILASLKLGRVVSQISSDLLLLLSDHSEILIQSYPEIPSKIVQVLCQTLSLLCGDEKILSGKEGQYLVLSLLFCLAEWVMRLPPDVLNQPSYDGKPILQLVFKILHVMTSGGKAPHHMKTTRIETTDIDTNIKEDNVERDLASTIRRNMGPFANLNTVRLAARAITNHLVNHLWHFPLGVGAQRLSSVVVETDDLPGFSCTEELTTDIFSSPHVQMFALNHSSLLSLIQLPSLQMPGGASTVGFKTPASEVRLILRDLSGKFTWDASTLYAPPSTEDYIDCKHSGTSSPISFGTEEDSGINSAGGGLTPMGVGSCPLLHQTSPKIVIGGPTSGNPPCFNISGANSTTPTAMMTSQQQTPMGMRDEMTSSMIVTSPPRHTLRHRAVGVLPSVEDSADDLDNLDDLLNYIAHTSPEMVEQFSHPLNAQVGPPNSLPGDVQTDAISSILNQRNLENEYFVRHQDDPNMVCPKEFCPAPIESESVFQQCRKFFDQLGLASFEKRKSIHTLRKNEKLLRELKNLDNQKCRETHKVAVIYVAEGQEDKLSILSNSGGSEGFEEFVSGLGWEVELATHSGFLGGLQRNGSTGDTAPYYATSLTEILFHVSTRMPSSSEESSFQKVRHLGNDEVHIVWSEHWRDYRRGIIPTEFCDVLIIIYPLENHLFRIQISTKSDVPVFGPLFDGAIVSRRVLSKLVRATAINASRVKRSRLPLYQHFYEERARSLETIIENHSEATTFEHFLADIYSPVSYQHNNTMGSRNPVLNSSQLTAALIDNPSQSSPKPPLTRPTSYSVGEHHNVREKVRNALGGVSHRGDDHHGGDLSSSSRGGSASPRNPKKHSFKVPRKMGVASNVSTTGNSSQGVPPESPVAPPRKHKDTFYSK